MPVVRWIGAMFIAAERRRRIAPGGAEGETRGEAATKHLSPGGAKQSVSGTVSRAKSVPRAVVRDPISTRSATNAA